ncbi:MAG TPA: hypothetical protein VH722_06865 [Alphaproteobacteria bacterium]|jgi:hypothetical protein|nr:hypothetical protein [Alphaproteobacteria bacterium]
MVQIDRLLVFALLLLPTYPAYAAPQADADKLTAGIMAFANKPEHRQIVAATAVEAFKTFQQCDSGKAGPAAKPLVFSMFGPLIVDANSNLASGLIKESVVVTGCGKQKVENILTLSDKGQLKSIAGLPGTSKADPLLAKDSKQYAYMGAVRKIGQCKDIRIIDTRYEDYEGPPNPKAKSQSEGGRPWRETWTLNACGTLVDTVIHYIPDETGTVIQSATQ